MGKLKGWALGGDTAAADRSWGFSSPQAPEAGRGKRAAAGAWSPAGGWEAATEHLCHSFSYLGTKGPNFLLQMCSSVN